MQISIIAVVCHALAGAPSDLCHEELITKTEMENSIIACALTQPALAEWKMNSKFAGDQWYVKRVRCVPGNYVLKDVI